MQKRKTCSYFFGLKYQKSLKKIWTGWHNIKLYQPDTAAT
jgi:hypothetical protein